MIFLIKSLEQYSNDIDIKVSETLSEVVLSLKIGKLVDGFLNAFCAALSEISSRDRFRLSGPMDNIWSEASPSFSDALSELVAEVLEEDTESTCDFELTITKEIFECRSSIYFINAFNDFIEKNDLHDTLKYLNKNFDKFLVFEVFDDIDKFGSNSLIFSSVTKRVEPEAFCDRKLIKRNFQENCSSVDFDIVAGNFLPFDFSLEKETVFNGINKFFNKANVALSLVFLANSSKIKSNLSIDYKILGYKSVVVNDFPNEFSKDFTERLFVIFEWVYQGGSISDKIGLVRNLISIHLYDDGRPKIDDVLWDAINSNYQIYLKNNIETYLSVKEKISDVVQIAADKVSILVDEYLNSAKNSVFVVVTFLITVVLVNGVKDNGVEVIFSTVYVYVVVLISIISAGYLLFVERDAKERYKRSVEQFLNKINNSYGEMLVASEVKSSRDEVEEENIKYLNKKLKQYRFVWIVIFTLFCLSFIVGNFMFTPDSAQDLFDPKNFTTTKNTV